MLGAIALWLILENRSTQAAIGGVTVLVGGTLLTVIRDLHGPPIMVGALMGWAMLKKAKDDQGTNLSSQKAYTGEARDSRW